MQSYIALANLCADAFVDDLESQSTSIYADVSSPDGLEINFTTYEAQIENIQNSLMIPATEPDDDGKWKYVLSNPMLPIEYAGIEDSNFLKYAKKLLNEAKLSIPVKGPLAVTEPDNDDEDFGAAEEHVVINDILFEVVLEKGTRKVVQEYRLSGEKLAVRADDTSALFQIRGDDAECILESQAVKTISMNKEVKTGR